MNHPYSEKPQNIEGRSIEKNAGIVVFIIGGVTYAEVRSFLVWKHQRQNGCLTLWQHFCQFKNAGQ